MRLSGATHAYDKKTLERLFDFQKFSQNSRLADLIDETEKRCDNALSDDELENVSAAGEPAVPKNRAKNREDKPDD